MLFELITVVALSCPKPVLMGDSFLDSLGQSTIKRAGQVCLTRYKGCLVKLTRKEQDFKAICRRNPK